MSSGTHKSRSQTGRVGRGPRDKSDVWYALSVKQPWAALLTYGVKSVEVRTWPTTRRGRLLIHAGKVADDRPEAWAWVTTPELRAATELRGGVVGVGELTACVPYPTRLAFEADRGRHLNPPDWFIESGLFGFAFRDLRPVTFYPWTGNTFFFPVDGFDLTSSLLPQDERRTSGPASSG
jgi:hypothetical protein